MNALLLVAHGSRRTQSNEEIATLSNRLQKACSDHYGLVSYAFLEFADPSIPDGIRRCINNGALSIAILPYFLNSGNHVTQDIPKIVGAAQLSYPTINMCILPHIGGADQMINVLIDSANNAIKN